MAKKARTTVFRCGSCGHEETKWLGRCPECGEWNTLAETVLPQAGKGAFPGGGTAGRRGLPESWPLSAIDPDEGKRIGSGLAELDRVLGGGIMKRSCVLIGGEPGIGKSTLLLQAAAAVSDGTKGRVLYVSGEESAGQIRSRAGRLEIAALSRIEICCSSRLEDVLTVMDAAKPLIVMVDSLQTLHSDEAGPAPGTPNQMKYCAWELSSWARDHDAAVFLVAHVTKEGIISGPKTVEHLVDTVAYFEGAAAASDGDCRFLRTTKNRFGPIDEIGIFSMGAKGLIQVENPSSLFLVRRDGALPPGVAVAVVLEGTRTLLVEIQALTVPAQGATSRVFSGQIDHNRVSRIAATLEKHLNIRFQDQDLYINIAGGIRIAETGADLALASALYSARTGIPLPADTSIAGELSLAGEVRPVRRLAGRVKTAAGLGYGNFLGPLGEGNSGGVASLKSAIERLFVP